MFDYEILVTIIIALTELLKQTEIFPKKFLPFFTLFLGIATGILYISPYDFMFGIYEGLKIGLVCTGTWSAGKNIYEGLKIGGK